MSSPRKIYVYTVVELAPDGTTRRNLFTTGHHDRALWLSGWLNSHAYGRHDVVGGYEVITEEGGRDVGVQV